MVHLNVGHPAVERLALRRPARLRIERVPVPATQRGKLLVFNGGNRVRVPDDQIPENGPVLV